mmetsp:Transcript_30124/g.89636  ORF Transcript_30124/g.89636 Transcript_30124/m.89636 type:complete len:88 (+) Transcript_30124:423-686(+)
MKTLQYPWTVFTTTYGAKYWHSVLCRPDLQSYTWHNLLQYFALRQEEHIFIRETRRIQSASSPSSPWLFPAAAGGGGGIAMTLSVVP